METVKVTKYALFAKVQGTWRFEDFTSSFEEVEQFLADVLAENGPNTAMWFVMEDDMPSQFKDRQLRDLTVGEYVRTVAMNECVNDDKITSVYNARHND